MSRMTGAGRDRIIGGESRFRTWTRADQRKARPKEVDIATSDQLSDKAELRRSQRGADERRDPRGSEAGWVAR
jgi:hypothetical protein